MTQRVFSYSRFPKNLIRWCGRSPAVSRRAVHGCVRTVWWLPSGIGSQKRFCSFPFSFLGRRTFLFPFRGDEFSLFPPSPPNLSSNFNRLQRQDLDCTVGIVFARVGLMDSPIPRIGASLQLSVEECFAFSQIVPQ